MWITRNVVRLVDPDEVGDFSSLALRVEFLAISLMEDMRGGIDEHLKEPGHISTVPRMDFFKERHRCANDDQSLIRQKLA